MSRVLPRGVPFTQIANQFILDTRLSHSTKCVYLYLMYRANSEARAWPSLRLIAEDMGMSTATASKAIDILEQLGWVIVDRPIRAKGDRHRPVNQYVVNGTLVSVTEHALVATTERGRSNNRTSLVSETATEQQPGLTTTKEQQLGDKSPRSLLKDAIAAWWTGSEAPFSLTASEWGRIERAAKELDDIGATPVDVAARGAVWWPKMEKSPQGLVQNWTRLAPDTAHVHDFKANGAWGVMCVACGERKPE